MNHRPDRVSGLIQAELGKIMIRDLDFLGVLVTITEVVVDKKLDTATVKVGVIPSSKDEETLHYLRKHQGELQFSLNRVLNIRPMPRIQFEVDHGVENAAKVEKILLEEDNKEVPTIEA